MREWEEIQKVLWIIWSQMMKAYFWPIVRYGIIQKSGRTKFLKEPSVRPTSPVLYLGLLGNLQCVIDLDPKVSNGALQLDMTEQELDGP